MANEMITQLPTVTSAQLTDIIMAVQGYISPSSPGTSVQESLQQVQELMLANTILTFTGNPNSNVAGTRYQLLWDSIDNLLYVCTTAGTTTTAVWTPSIGQLTNGQLLIGSTGNPPVQTTLTAGSNISILNTAGAITISTSGGVGFTWTHVTGTTQTLASNNGYIVDNAGLVTLTLPATSNFGDEIVIIGRGAGGWTITQAASQQIIIGTSSTTAGVGGSLSSTNRRDCLFLICSNTNLEWTSLSAQGNLTIV